jgi:hypothetical protein
VENVIIKFVADTDGLQPAIKQLEAIGKITAEDAARIQKLNDEQREYIQTVNQTTTAFGNLQAEAKDVAAAINAQVLQGVADAMAEMGEEAQKGATKFKSLKAELRELKAQIAKGDMGAKELREATKRAAELEDQIGDVSEKVKALASDTKYIDSAVTAMRGLAAAGAVTQGAMALLGNENEDLQKTMMKVQAATAVLMGVQEMATIVTGQSAAKTLFLDAAQKVAAVSSKALGVTISTSMAAATMGLSLVIGAIAVLSSDLADANEEVKKSVDESDRILADAEQMRIKRRMKGKEQDIALEKLAFEREKANLNKMIEERKISEDAYMKMFVELSLGHQQNLADIDKKYKDEELKRQKDLHSKKKAERKKDAEDEEKDLERRQQLNKAAMERDLRSQLAALQLEALNRNETNDEIAAMLADNFDKQIELRKQMLILNESLTLKELELETAKLDEEAKVYRAMLAAKVLAAKHANQEITTDTEESTKKQTNYVQQYADAATSIMTTLLQTNKELTQRQLEAQLAAIQEERDTALRTIDLTEAQRLKIEERYRQQEKQIKEQAFKQQKQADVIQATINTALAISRALTGAPPPANFAMAAAAGVAGAAQVALIASQPLPRFAKGTEQFITDGTGTSDSGLAWLSNGERVVPASINSEYWGALSAIHNRKVSPRLANSVIEELSRGGSDAIGFDYDRLGRVIGGGKGSSKVVINLDERGFTKHVMRENSRVTYLNKKLRLTA